MVFKKIIFQNSYVELETPPPFMEKTILNFHFDYLNSSLIGRPHLHLNQGSRDAMHLSVFYHLLQNIFFMALMGASKSQGTGISPEFYQQNL